MRVAPPIVLTEEEHKKLTQLAKSRTTTGESNEAIAEALGVGCIQVGPAGRPHGVMSLLTSSPPLAFSHRLRGKGGDSYGAQAACA